MKALRKIRQAWNKLLIYLFTVSLFSAFIGGASFASPSTEGIQVYQKNLHLTAEHKKNLADAITRYRNADNLWDVLRDEFTLPHYEDNPAVQEKIEWYMNNQDYLIRSASRAAPYLYYILQQVKKRHLPAELVLLPIIESGYNPSSTSTVGAAGIWQLMPETAADLGVRQDWWYDGRRDVIASTRAALNHLAYLESFFDGNWLWALAAYDTGEGNLLAAIKRNIRDGVDTDFWSLPLSSETRNYVPSLLALAVIISHPDQYPIYFPPVRNAPYLAQVDVGEQISMKYAASLAGISAKQMTQLNPGYTRLFTSSKGPYKLVLPIENVEQFTENLARSPLSQKINWIHYHVKPGDTLASVATKYNTNVEDIRKLNHLSKNTLQRVHNLLIPYNSKTAKPTVDAMPEVVASTTHRDRKTATLIATALQGSNGKYSLQPGDTVYMVRDDDTLEKIANHFHITKTALMSANQLSSNKVKPATQLIIPTHPVRTQAMNIPTSANKVQPGDTVYMVRHGDTVEKIAAKFNTSASAIRLANLIDNSSLQEGERIVVPTHIQG